MSNPSAPPYPDQPPPPYTPYPVQQSSHPASHQPNSGYPISNQPQQYPYVPNQPVPDPPVFQQQPPGFDPNQVAGARQQCLGQPQTQYYQQQPGNTQYTRLGRSVKRNGITVIESNVYIDVSYFRCAHSTRISSGGIPTRSK